MREDAEAHRATTWKLLVGPIAVAVACAGGARRPPEATPNAALPTAAATEPAVHRSPDLPDRPAVNAAVAARFAHYLKHYENLTIDGLRNELHLGARALPELSFDPADAKYFAEVTQALDMTPEERTLLREQGVVSVDHAQDFSMASAYYGIYTRDLPVLVTTDSILHALHRSYDAILKELEQSLFMDTIDGVLTAVHDEVGQELRKSPEPSVAESLRDLDLYLSVARNLLAGAEAPSERQRGQSGSSAAGTVVRSKAGQDREVSAILSNVASRALERPLDGTKLYGGERPIDYSQFKPRGHYTESIELQRYFRSMMWLGRADTGFILEAPPSATGIVIVPERERRNAAILTRLLSRTDALRRFAAMSDILDFMVGKADNLTPQLLMPALSDAGFESLPSFADDARLRAVFASIETPSAQQIRSQVIKADPSSPTSATPPALFQLSGQRFTLDSFFLSKVVYDDIVFQKQKPLRTLPSGLDVMASLGNDEAVRLLEPELERYHYSANLLAARRVVEDHTEASWQESLYATWLGALRTLDDVPADARHFPRAMRSLEWQRKQLQTQLASWAELRHDTLLYAKQSYTAYGLCEYPAGYVEPYPEFFRRLGTFAEEAQRRLGTADLSHPDPKRKERMDAARNRQRRFFHRFESIMKTLESLARKELAAQAFTEDEALFLKKTIDIRGGGSGAPRYDGWYRDLIYGGDPAAFKPTVADVHTYPGDNEPPAVLEVATGRTMFVVVAIDNQNDHAIYVGPAYSYYEFTVPPAARLDDPTWSSRLAGADAPKRPAWTQSFQPPAKQRHLARRPPRAAKNATKK